MRPIGGATSPRPPATPAPFPLFDKPVSPTPPPPPMKLVPLAGDKRAARPMTADDAAIAAGALAPDDAKRPLLLLLLLLLVVALEAPEGREPGVEAEAMVELVSDLVKWRSCSPREPPPPPMPMLIPMPMPRLLFGEMERLAQESLLSRSDSLSCLPCFRSERVF